MDSVAGARQSGNGLQHSPDFGNRIGGCGSFHRCNGARCLSCPLLRQRDNPGILAMIIACGISGLAVAVLGRIYAALKGRNTPSRRKPRTLSLFEQKKKLKNILTSGSRQVASAIFWWTPKIPSMQYFIKKRRYKSDYTGYNFTCVSTIFLAGVQQAPAKDKSFPLLR